MSVAESINWRLIAGTGKKEWIILPRDMKKFSCVELLDQTVCRIWKGMKNMRSFQVEVKLKPLPNGLFEGHISWKNYHGAEPIIAADFPWRTVSCQSDSGVLSGDFDIGLIFPVKNCEPRVYQQSKQSLMLLAFLNADHASHYFKKLIPHSLLSSFH